MSIPIPELPDENTTICLVIPDSQQWRQIYMGAILILQQWWYYDTNDANEVEDVVQRVMECHYLTTQDYEGCMELDCQDIIDCIDDPESGVAQAIIDLVNLETYADSVASGQSQNTTPIAVGSNPTCDRDILFGQCLQLMEYFDQRNTDAIEILEAATNELDFIAEVIGDITIIDEASVDAFLSWVQFLQENIAENYAAQVTTAYLEEIACDLFCRSYLQGCAITPDIIFAVFADRLSSLLTVGGTIVNTLNYLVGGEWTGTQIADFLFLAQVGFRSQVGKFLGINGYADLDLRLRVYANDPNSDWELLCDECCDQVDETFDFTTDDYDEIWTVRDGTFVSYVASTGYVGDMPFGAQIVTDRYESISYFEATVTTVEGSPIGQAIDFDPPSPYTVNGSIGISVFEGNYDLIGVLGAIGYSSVNNDQQCVLQSVRVIGCLASE